MSGGDIATYLLDEADAHILFKMVYYPSQVSMDGFVDSDVSVRCVFSANFGVEVVEHWTEECIKMFTLHFLEIFLYHRN